MPAQFKPTQKLIVDIQCASPALEKSLSSIASTPLIKKWVKTAVQRSGLLTLRFVNKTEGKQLNLSFRNKDKPTNVLTFPYELTKQTLTADIVFCLPVVQKEVREQGKTANAHLAHLIIHGCMHAQGHDHETDKDAQKMESLEIKILKNLGFTNPYIPQ